jgi:hypothetical protein
MAAGGAGGDEAALLAFKAAVISGGHGDDPLALWNTTSGTDGGDYCGWEGVPFGGGGEGEGEGSGRRRRVVALSLPSRGLTGVLSPAVGNLTSIRMLNLTFNWFQGTIPASIGRLVRLKTLDLSYNTFSGALPANLSSCVLFVLSTRQQPVPWPHSLCAWPQAHKPLDKDSQHIRTFSAGFV